MKDLKNFNIKDPLNIFMIAMLLLVLSFGGYMWFFVFDEMTTEKAALEKTVSENTQKIKKLEKQKREEKKLDSDLKGKEERLKELKRMFPDAENVSARLRDLYTVFRKTSIDVVSFKPSGKDAGPPKLKNGKIDLDNPKAYYEENYYDLTLEGGFHQFGDFFAELANFEYPTKIDAMGVTVLSSMNKNIEKAMITGQEPKTISVKIKLTTFNSRKEQPAPKDNKKGKKKNIKKKGKK